MHFNAASLFIYLEFNTVSFYIQMSILIPAQPCLALQCRYTNSSYATGTL